MPLAFPVLKLPDVEETIAFRAVDFVLKHDSHLKRVLKTYNSWTGEPIDTVAPTSGTCAFLQIAPKPLPGQWESEGQQRLPLAIAITCAVNGTSVDQIMNLWGHVRRALWPADPTAYAAVSARMATAKITKATLSLGAYGAHLPKDGGKILVAQGTLNLVLLIPTS